jgi:hypothetical protein
MRMYGPLDEVRSLVIEGSEEVAIRESDSKVREESDGGVGEESLRKDLSLPSTSSL